MLGIINQCFMFIFCIPWHHVKPDIIIYSRAQVLSLTPSPRSSDYQCNAGKSRQRNFIVHFYGGRKTLEHGKNSFTFRREPASNSNSLTTSDPSSARHRRATPVLKIGLPVLSSFFSWAPFVLTTNNQVVDDVVF